MKNIVLTGGGTAGHCIPNVSLLPYLKKEFSNIYYIGSKDGIERKIIEKNKIEYFSVSCAKLKRSFSLSNLLIPFTVIKGIKEAGKILDKLKPSIIFSKGGYVSVPVVISAKKRKIPVISHESDLTIGLANKINSKNSKYLLTSFQETAKLVKNGLYVGPPLKNSLFTPSNKIETLKKIGLSNDKPILLITGGSQGAQSINEAVYSSIHRLSKIFNVIHLCGKNNINHKINVKNYKQIEFYDNIEEIFKISDVCITRAGSNTLFELLSLKIPSLVIPLENKASRGDQVLNAKYFKNKNMINVLHEKNLSPTRLINETIKTFENANFYRKNINANPIINSTEKIYKIISLCSENTAL